MERSDSDAQFQQRYGQDLQDLPVENDPKDRWATVEAIEVGDKIKFKACTRSDYRAVWRIVNGVNPLRVRYHGWGEFQVRDDEVLEVAKEWK